MDLEATIGATVLTVGHVTHDLYPNGVRAGGSAYYGARAMRALGARSRLVTSVGADFACHDELRGLELLVNLEGSTTYFENAYPVGRRRVQRVGAVSAAVTPKSLPAEWREVDVLFLAPVIGEVDACAWLDTVRARIIGCGIQGFIKGAGRREGAGSRAVVARPFTVDTEVLALIDVAFLSDEDLAELGSDDLLVRLKRSVATVVLTLGERGARIWSRGHECTAGTFPAVAKDPTGAGDVFAAAFLLAAAGGETAAEAARFASAAASVVVEGEAGAELSRVGEARERVGRVSILEEST